MFRHWLRSYLASRLDHSRTLTPAEGLYPIHVEQVDDDTPEGDA